jgi:diguanylate cyclase (GGDEF)-like protein
MSTRRVVNPIKSRLGREIYLRAALLATVPLIFAGLISFSSIDSPYLFVAGVLGTISITVLAASYVARRFLTPLAEILKVTRLLADRDFSARAEFSHDDEFSDVAMALNRMAQTLDRQFLQREALSRLDYLILAGDNVDDVFRTAISEALSYLPFDSIELDIEARIEGKKFRYSLSRGELEPEKTLIRYLDQKYIDETSNPRRACATSSIIVADMVRGVVRGYSDDFDATRDDLSVQQLSELGDRIAMALEFNEKSDELNRRAFFDDLTGLPNRETCFQKINRAIQTAALNDHMVALLYIDLDGFKSVNDSLGHDAGDQLIRMAAHRITRCVGPHGVTARLGGDEFAVIIPYSSGRSEDYKTIGKEILAELQSPFTIGNTEAFLGASIGTARYPDDGNTHTELLRKADAAMYRAKDTGRGRQVDYSRTLGIVIAKRLRLEADLNRALERDEMSLLYQPQIDLNKGTMTGAEALLRWNHATEGQISPEEFIPIAEETNQIIVLGNWVLYNACRQFSEWRERAIGIERIAVNVSANQLRRPEFLEEVTGCLSRFGMRPEMLELELTERVFVDSRELSSSILALKKMGILIAIDDFGTGYSSLGYLRNLHFDKVKVDRSFVGSLPHDKQSASIIQAVLAMCRTLGKTVVAEGVETSSQLQYLANAGVEFAQGYYFGKPMPPDQLEFMLRSAQETSDGALDRLINVSAR